MDISACHFSSAILASDCVGFAMASTKYGSAGRRKRACACTGMHSHLVCNICHTFSPRTSKVSSKCDCSERVFSCNRKANLSILPAGGSFLSRRTPELSPTTTTKAHDTCYSGVNRSFVHVHTWTVSPSFALTVFSVALRSPTDPSLPENMFVAPNELILLPRRT